MSKRQIDAESSRGTLCSSPNIIVVPTVAFIGENVPDLPAKKPKLGEPSQPLELEEIKKELDTIPKPPLSLPKDLPQDSKTVMKSENFIKSEVLSVITKKKQPICETNVKGKQKSPETANEVVKELKSTSKQPSWASDYLKSIGLAYKKPIKINLSSCKKELNVASEELSKLKSTDNDAPGGLKSENLNKWLSESPANDTHVLITNEAMPNLQIEPQPYFDNNHSEMLNVNKTTFDSNLNKRPSESPANETHILTNPPTNEAMPNLQIEPQPYFHNNHSEMLNINKNTFDSNLNKIPSELSANETLVTITNHSNNEVMRYPEINPQPYFHNIHPEIPCYLNCCPSFSRDESLYTSNSFTENNWSREATFYRPADDKSYLDKVEQFLSKISQENCVPKSDLVTKTRRKSLSLKHHDDTAAENPQNLRTKTRIDDKTFQTQLRDGSRQLVEGKKKYNSEECYRYKSKSSERYKERPSTSKQNYDCKGNKKNEYKDAAELITKHTKLEDFRRREIRETCNSSSHLKTNRERPSCHIPKSSSSKTYKTRESSESSSSEFIRKQSYQDYQNPSNNKTHTKRQRSSSCSSSENDRGSSSRPTDKTTQNKKKILRRDYRDSSDSSSCSMPCCSRKIQCHKKLKSRRERCHSSSNSEICERVSPKHAQKPQKTLERGGSPIKAQKDKKIKTSREISICNRSDNCEATLPCSTKKSKDIMKQKSRRERSNSSSNSESCANKLPCHAHRIHEKKKRKRAISNSSSNSENASSLRAHEHKEKPDKRNKNKSSKDKSIDGNKSKKVIKEVICKDTICNGPKASSKKDKYAELKLTDNKQKAKSQLPPTMHSSKEVSDVKYNRTVDLASIKSVVQVKDLQKLRHKHNTHETENFDLRSKLSRKGLGKISKICDKNFRNDSKNKINPRENLFITVENQNEDKEKSIKTVKGKLIETSQKNVEIPKTKKHKNMKLVINVIYDSSQSSDSDGGGGTTGKKIVKEYTGKAGKGPIVKKVIKESNLTNEELSFLDDLNIDEIVDSLTRNKNELCSLKNTTAAAVTIVSSSSPEIDTYDLVSEDGNSEASTVHLEELRDETHDDDTGIVVNQCSRISSSLLKTSDIGNLNNTNITKRTVKEESIQKAMMCENEIKQEIPYEDSNKVVRNNDKCTNKNLPEDKIKEEPAHKDLNEEVRIFETENKENERYLVSTNKITKFEEANVRSTKDYVIPVKEIKEEPADNVLDDAGRRNENKNNETECNLISTTEITEKIKDEYNAVPVNETKEPTVTSCPSLLDSPDYRREFPLIPPNEIKEETLNRVANESDIQNSKLESLKINAKENKNTDNQELESGINTVINKNEDSKKSEERHNYNLSTGVCDSGVVTNILEQSEGSSCNKEAANDARKSSKFTTKHTNCKAIVHNSMTISDIIDLTHELQDIKEEPSSDPDKVDESIIQVFSSIETPVPASLDKANTEKIKKEESQHVKEMQLNRMQNSNEESPCNTDLQIQKSTNLDTINIQNTILITASDNDVPVHSKISENITTFEAPPDTELKIDEDTKPKKEVSKDAKNESLQHQKDDDNDSSKFQIKTSDANTSNTNIDILPHKNTAVDSDRKLQKHQAQLKTSNVFEKYNKVPKTAKDTAIPSRGGSPICVKTKQSSIRSKSPKASIELVLSSEDKTMIGRLEDRLLNYLHEPYTVNSLLHRGMFSKIFKCKDTKGQQYVVKMLRNGSNNRNKGIAKEKLLNSLQKDIPEQNLNFVRFINGLEVAGQWCFLMEYFPKNLSQVLEENNKSLHIKTVQLLSKQLVAAVKVLRHQNVVHSDIKPGHILLNCATDRLKLCGFDSSYYVNKPNKLPSIGTVNYRAPETILGYSTGYSVDVWSTALVMFEMAARRQLFPGKFNNDILFKQMCTREYIPYDMIRQSLYARKHFQGRIFKRYRFKGQSHDFVYMGEHQIFKNNILQSAIRSTYYKEWAKNISKKQKSEEIDIIDDFCQLLEKMLTIHPNERLTIERVDAHPFMSHTCVSN